MASISQKLFGHYTYTIRHGLASGMRRKGGLGFLPIKAGENAETEFLRRLPLAGKVVYDIGAFEGLLTLFFAKRAKRVISWEPNPSNYARAATNLKLNQLPNVQILNRGISNAPGTIELTYDPLMPGAGSGNSTIGEQIRETVNSAKGITIPVAMLDDEIVQHSLPLPDLVKLILKGWNFRRYLECTVCS